MGRIGRSFQLVGQSYRLLMKDKELMVLPLISGVAITVILAGFAVGFGLNPSMIRDRDPVIYIPIFLMYVATYTIGIFFQAAVVAGASERMRGGDPTVGSALAAAGRRIGPIVMWAVVAATVGVVIRAIHDRLGFVGKIIAGLIGAGWSLATLFVVPVLVLEDRSIGESFSRSLTVFKQTWGESVVGGTTLGAALVCAWVTLVAMVGLTASALGLVAALVVFGIGAVLIMVVSSALQGIYIASLYRYAVDGPAAAGLDPALLTEAFVPRKR